MSLGLGRHRCQNEGYDIAKPMYASHSQMQLIYGMEDSTGIRLTCSDNIIVLHAPPCPFTFRRASDICCGWRVAAGLPDPGSRPEHGAKDLSTHPTR
jgi:hypothetical protein